MTASIIEHLDGTSFVVVISRDSDHHIFDITVTDSREELGQFEEKSFHQYMVFSYSLLGDPNADAEEIFDVDNFEDECACAMPDDMNLLRE